MRGFYWIFERLDTTPGQEKAIREAGEGVFANVESFKDEATAFKKDLARAVREESFDQAALDEAFARQDERIAALRVSLNHAFGSMHEVLDDRQRRRLAEILHEGGGFRNHGPYRARGAF